MDDKELRDLSTVKMMSRREYLKILALLGGASATALFGIPRIDPYAFDRKPEADFEYRPDYINPTSEDTIQFLNKSRDPDNEDTVLNDIRKLLGYKVPQDLKYSWYVDDRIVANTGDYSTKLPASLIGTDHKIRLRVSDRRKEDYTEKVVEVDPDELYPEKELRVPLKSIVYDAGTQFKYEGWDNTRYWLNKEQFEREIVDIINRELGCNAIRFSGTNYQYMFELVEIAIDKGNFDSILISPRFISETRNETLNKIVKFAKKSEDLRKKHKGIIFSVGNELSLDTRGIGSDLHLYRDRVDVKWNKNWKSELDDFLDELSSTVSKYFKGYLTYASGFWEHPIDWNDLRMSIISVNDYIDNRDIEDYKNQLKELKLYGKLHGKPVHITEFGSATFEGAFEFGGLAWKEKDKTYSQEAQVQGIKKYLKIFNEIGLDACTLHQFYEMVDDDRVCFGITKFSKSGPPQRKLGFYMYKSYQLQK